MSKPSSLTRFHTLDILRLIATAMVVWYHIAITYNYPIRGGITIPRFYHISLGNVAVTIFLILSGLVLELQYGQRKLSFKHFFFKRIIKIYAVYWTTLIVALIIRGYKNILYFQEPLFSCPECTVINWSCTITGFCAQIGLWGGPFMRTSWFISVIVLLYATFPFLSRKVKAHPYIWLIGLFMVTLVSRFIITKWRFLPGEPLEWLITNRIFEFGFGIFLAGVIPVKILQGPPLPSMISKALTYLAELSFPIFLLHYELDFMIILFSRWGASNRKGTLIYLGLVFLVCYLTWWVAQRLHQFLTTKLLSKVVTRR